MFSMDHRVKALMMPQSVHLFAQISRYYHKPSFANECSSPQVLRITFWKLVETYVQLLWIRISFFVKESLPVDHKSRLFGQSFHNHTSWEIILLSMRPFRSCTLQQCQWSCCNVMAQSVSEFGPNTICKTGGSISTHPSCIQDQVHIQKSTHPRSIYKSSKTIRTIMKQAIYIKDNTSNQDQRSCQASI